MQIRNYIADGHACSSVQKNMERIQREIEECEERICLYQVLLDDARSRKDYDEISYFSNEIRHERRAKKHLMASEGLHDGGTHENSYI